MAEVCAELEVPKLYQFHASSAMEPQQADVEVTVRAPADLLRPGTPNSAQTSTHVARMLLSYTVF